MATDFTVGVEEEYQILDARTRALRSRAERVLERTKRSPSENIQPELHSSQIEVATPVCTTLPEVKAELARLRRRVIDAAAADGNEIAAAGTHPFSSWDEQPITPTERYFALEKDYQQVARETVCFSYHVHVGIADRELAIQTMNRTRVWLAPILALAANSPFWLDTDTGYASFRTEIARRWPTAGLQEVFSSRREYEELVRALVDNETITDASQIYWDVRPSAHAETIEFRVTDVCMWLDEAVMVAGLCRSLARTCYAEAVRDEPIRHLHPQLLSAAKWRAARYGLGERLLDDLGASRPAPDVVVHLLDYLRADLVEHNEWDEVSALVSQTLECGNGADRQRAVYRKTGDLREVVAMVVCETSHF